MLDCELLSFVSFSTRIWGLNVLLIVANEIHQPVTSIEEHKKYTINKSYKLDEFGNCQASENFLNIEIVKTMVKIKVK